MDSNENPKSRTLEASHASVRIFQEFLPEATIAGGSFSSWLPKPKSIALPQRREAVSAARKIAVRQCLGTLLNLSGLSHSEEIPSNQDGSRRWPEGFTGSLTHKGTVVLGAMLRLQLAAGVGIDLEREDGKDLSEISGLFGPEELPKQSSVTPTMIFSVKEAVFKAQFRLTGLKLDFSDVKIKWIASDGIVFTGIASSPNGLSSMVKCATIDRWICSSAKIPH